MKRLTLLAGMWLCSTAADAATHYEHITFINGDGHSYVNYVTTRSEASSYTVFLDKSDLLQRYLYINPNHYTLDASQADSNRLTFDHGSYAMMGEGDFIDVEQPENSRVTSDDQGIYTLKTWNGKTRQDGHFGYWNTPEPYTRFAAAWIFPQHYEVVDYFGNRQGEWVQRGNTLAFFATDTNDLTFEIRYRASSQPTFAALKKQMRTEQTVSVQQQADEIRVTFIDELLFASGSDQLSARGQALIEKVRSSLQSAKAENYEVIVSGHTDDVPIANNRFASNWELSSQRALNVVHALINAGVPPQLLQARAFADYRPRRPNISDANRRANRRIEITIAPLDAKPGQ